MAKELDSFTICDFDCGKEETIKITIALAEYRSLVSENTRLEERIKYLENRLWEETNKLTMGNYSVDSNVKEGADNG